MCEQILQYGKYILFRFKGEKNAVLRVVLNQQGGMMEEEGLYSFMKQIQKIEVSEHDETLRLAKLAREGDLEARNRLVEGNLRFVSKIANTYKGNGLPLPDLINEGCIGLMTATERFDPDSGNAFLTYARFWIHQAISSALKDKARMIRIPANKVEKLTKILRCKAELETNTDGEVSAETIASQTGIDLDEVKCCLSVKDDATSLDLPLQGVTDKTILDTVESEYPNPEESLLDSDMLTQIEGILSTLPDRHRDIIVRRYGLFNTKAQSLDEVGKVYGITRERVRQIETAALKKLRLNPVTDGLRVYLNAS